MSFKGTFQGFLHFSVRTRRLRVICPAKVVKKKHNTLERVRKKELDRVGGIGARVRASWLSSWPCKCWVSVATSYLPKAKAVDILCRNDSSFKQSVRRAIRVSRSIFKRKKSKN